MPNKTKGIAHRGIFSETTVGYFYDVKSNHFMLYAMVDYLTITFFTVPLTLMR